MNSFVTGCNWVNFIVDCAVDHAVTIGEIVERNGAHAVSVLASQNGKRTAVIGLFEADSEGHVQLIAELSGFKQVDRSFSIRLESLEDRDWVSEVQKNLKPIQFASGLRIIAPWHDEVTSEKFIDVLINPGQSFGTGHHSTTYLCLEFLSKMALSGQKVLDYGCGSGILAISSLKLGADWAWGVDTDLDAVQESLENARRNNVHKSYSAGTPEDLPVDFEADIVVANLFLNVLQELSAKLSRLTRTGGWLVLSGVLRWQLPALEPYFEGSFDCVTMKRGDWALLAGRKKS